MITTNEQSGEFWDVMGDMGALICDVPDPASVAILAILLPDRVGRHLRPAVQRAVRARYRTLTRPGLPDGPP